ncbi:restriction endonuclease subunit S [Empedobacter falsenii]
MSKLDDLLQGVKVEWMPLEMIADYEQPTKYLVKTKDYNDTYNTPVLTAGKTFILGYTDEKDGINKASENPVIIFDDFTTSNKWVDFDFKAKSSAMKIIKSKNESKGLLRYIYYWINTLPSDLVDGDHKRQWISNFSKKIIPLPPIEIQQEIVRILDQLTETTNSLKTELENERQIRKKQFEFYREQLFTFEEGEIQSVELGELCKIGDGLHGTPKYNSSGDFYFINGNNLNNGTIVINDKTKKVDNLVFEKHGIELFSKKTILMSINGTIGSLSYFNNENIVLGKSVSYFNIISDKLTKTYLYYFLQTNKSKDYFEKNKTGSTIKNLGLKALRSFKIPIPSLEEQVRIVNLLDQFDAAHTAIEEELTKEIKLRTQQYEYYREKLLTFPKN